MIWYVSRTSENLNRLPFRPERITPYLCLNPKYTVTLEDPERIIALTDSGAFQDVKKARRLTFDAALKRQLDFEAATGYVSHEIVSYDQLVDEQNIGGEQVKKRWTVEAAEDAVETTVAAAKFLADRRKELRPRRLVLSCQGVTIKQYTRCVERVLEVATPEDTLGYGGFCIIGQKRFDMTPDWCYYPEQFYRICQKTMPLIAARGIKRIHVFGVMHLESLRRMAEIAKPFGFILSTDSSSVEQRSVIHGKVWDLETGFVGTPAYPKAKKYFLSSQPPDGFWHPNLLAHENIEKAVRTLAKI